MVWNHLKYDLENDYSPTTKQGLTEATGDFCDKPVTVKYCNNKINKLYEVRDYCILMKGNPTGF